MNEIGYIYCMSNPAYKDGMVKIGLTLRTVEERRRELRTTGVPLPFVVEFAKKVMNPSEKEKNLHMILAEKRISDDREFFDCPTEKVRVLFEMFEGEWWSQEETPSSPRKIVSTTSCKEESIDNDILAKKESLRKEIKEEKERIKQERNRKIIHKLETKKKELERKKEWKLLEDLCEHLSRRKKRIDRIRFDYKFCMGIDTYSSEEIEQLERDEAIKLEEVEMSVAEQCVKMGLDPSLYVSDDTITKYHIYP